MHAFTESVHVKVEKPLKRPQEVIKRKKSVNSSKFNQTDRRSKNCATFYFKHHDTDSERQKIETNDKSQEESFEYEWTYVGNANISSEISTGFLTSSVETQCELPLEAKKENEPKLNLTTPDLRDDHNSRCKVIERLVIQAEELVHKQAQQQIVNKKVSRNVKPLFFEEDGKAVSQAKMSRINEWLNHNNDKMDNSQVRIINFS